MQGEACSNETAAWFNRNRDAIIVSHKKVYADVAAGNFKRLDLVEIIAAGRNLHGTPNQMTGQSGIGWADCKGAGRKY